jgi:hypothetical protein
MARVDFEGGGVVRRGSDETLQMLLADRQGEDLIEAESTTSLTRIGVVPPLR